jgi:hypothetical protein
MNQQLDIRVGNIITYKDEFRIVAYVRVVDISILSDSTQRFTFQHRNQTGMPFEGSIHNIDPVSLTESHLDILNFQINRKLWLYIHNNLSIRIFKYPEGDDPTNLTLMNPGFVITPPAFPVTPTVEQVQSQTIAIPYLHMLQNYCSDNNIHGLDFNMIP